MITCHLNLAEEHTAAKRGQAHTDAGFPKVAGKNGQPKGGEDLRHGAAEAPSLC